MLGVKLEQLSQHLRERISLDTKEFDGIFNLEFAPQAGPIIELLGAECYSVNELSLI